VTRSNPSSFRSVTLRETLRDRGARGDAARGTTDAPALLVARFEPRRVSRGLQTLRGWGHDATDAILSEVRVRAVRMVMEHGAAHDSQWAAITSI
jgi:hypothetical protein